MSENLDKWLRPGKELASEQENTYIKDLIDFHKGEIQRFINPDFVGKVNSGELGMMLIRQLKEDTIEKPLKRDIEEDEDKIRFLKEMEKEIKKSIEVCENDSRIEDKKIKLIKRLLLDFVEKEKKLEEDMGKQGYNDKDFLRPFR